MVRKIPQHGFSSVQLLQQNYKGKLVRKSLRTKRNGIFSRFQHLGGQSKRPADHKTWLTVCVSGQPLQKNAKITRGHGFSVFIQTNDNILGRHCGQNTMTFLSYFALHRQIGGGISHNRVLYFSPMTKPSAIMPPSFLPKCSLWRTNRNNMQALAHIRSLTMRFKRGKLKCSYIQ